MQFQLSPPLELIYFAFFCFLQLDKQPTDDLAIKQYELLDSNIELIKRILGQYIAFGTSNVILFNIPSESLMCLISFRFIRFSLIEFLQIWFNLNMSSPGYQKKFVGVHIRSVFPLLAGLENIWNTPISSASSYHKVYGMFHVLQLVVLNRPQSDLASKRTQHANRFSSTMLVKNRHKIVYIQILYFFCKHNRLQLP